MTAQPTNRATPALCVSGGFTTGEFEKPRHPAVFQKIFADDAKRFDEQSALALARTGAGESRCGSSWGPRINSWSTIGG